VASKSDTTARQTQDFANRRLIAAQYAAMVPVAGQAGTPPKDRPQRGQARALARQDKLPAILAFANEANNHSGFKESYTVRKQSV